MIRTEGVNQMHHSTSSRSPLRRLLGFVLTLLILCVAVLGAFTVYELSRMDRDTRGDLHPGALDSFRSTGESIDWGLDSISGIKSRKVINILLIGQDRREGQESQMRSDSMILCSVQKKSGTIRLTSLMRDMFLPVAGGRYGPLNLTYYAGGMELLDDTIRQDFGVTVDANMEVDFFRFIALIDRLGGLDLELTQEEADWLNGTTGDYWQSQWNADAGISNAGWNLHAGWLLPAARGGKIRLGAHRTPAHRHHGDPPEGTPSEPIGSDPVPPQRHAPHPHRSGDRHSVPSRHGSGIPPLRHL